MKWKIAAVVYVLMAFFTNAYCQVHRWEDWRDSRGVGPDGPAPVKTLAATALWPIYWTSRGFLFLVENPPYTENRSE